MPVSYSGTAITWPDSSTTTSGWTGFKNRIINGAMVIDQRNAGASVALSSTTTFITDRWKARINTGSGTTGIQSSTAPSGFVKSLLFTVGTGGTPAASDNNWFIQPIEGFNVADLGWGTADAQPVTLSFKVRSSVTGTFAVSVRNDSSNRSYPATYTINSANTFETKTITIPGDTTGTWLTTNGTGIELVFDLGTGSNYAGTANAWAAADYRTATGATKLVQTNGATFYITGVQLEKGSTATSFDYRPYGTELALCQRYYWKATGGSDSTSYSYFGPWQCYSTTQAFGCAVWLPVTMRTNPTVGSTGTWVANNSAGGGLTITALTWYGNQNQIAGVLTVASGLVAGNASGINFTTSQTIYASAEL